MMTRAASLLFFLATAGCGGCGSQAASDARAVDARRRDSQVTDRAYEARGPDLDPAVCGGSRTRTPEAVTRGQGMSCGTGCKQVTFGDDVVEYDVSGDLLVYAGGVGISSLYFVDLKQDKEWLVHRSVNSDEIMSCSTVATDGTIQDSKGKTMVDVQAVNTTTGEVTIATALERDFKVSEKAALLYPLMGLSGNPLWVVDASSSPSSTQTRSKVSAIEPIS
jgi:hypothetical protein